MKQLRDSSLKKIIKFNKYEDLYDFESLECRVAFVFTIVFMCIYGYLSFVGGKDNFINKAVPYFDNIGIALIGFLGFIVTGLSILTGTISSKVVAHLQERNKIDALEKILLSYYLLGILSALLIMELAIVHFVSLCSIESNIYINIVLITINIYVFTFIIFYAVKLIGNCLEIFYIVNNMHIMAEKEERSENQYNEYKIRAIERILFENDDVKLQDKYKNIIKELIENDRLNNNDEQSILSYFHEQFDHK